MLTRAPRSSGSRYQFDLCKCPSSVPESHCYSACRHCLPVHQRLTNICTSSRVALNAQNNNRVFWVLPYSATARLLQTLSSVPGSSVTPLGNQTVTPFANNGHGEEQVERAGMLKKKKIINMSHVLYHTLTTPQHSPTSVPKRGCWRSCTRNAAPAPTYVVELQFIISEGFLLLL